MILTAFDVKFREKKDELPPRACRPLKKLKKNNVGKVDPKKVEKKTMSKKWVHRLSYTFINLHILSYTSN